jgi:hypothetical protein
MKLSYCRYVGLLIALTLFQAPSLAQKQVVFLQHGNVVARFTEGDRFKFYLKNHQMVEGYITELTDFSLITSGLDTISFLSIEKVNIKKQRGRKFTTKLGGVLLIGGVGYIAIDQLNVLIGSNQGGFNDGNQRALIVAGVGAALLLIKPKYKKVGRGVSVRTIDYKSPYYKLNR